MRVLKIFGLALLALIGLVIILGLIAPDRIITQQSTVINAPQSAVFAAVNDLEQWPAWSPWNRRDSTMQVTYTESTVGAGAYYTWTSETSGNGQMTITDTYGMDSLHTLVEFDGQGNTLAKFFFDPQGNQQTKVTWSFDAKFPFPFNAMLFFQDIKSFIDKDYAEGLGYLKGYVEARVAEQSELEVTTIDFPGAYYLVQRNEITMDEMPSYFATVMPAVGAAFTENGVEMLGPPSALIYVWDEENQRSDMALGIPAAPGITLAGLTVAEIPASQALRIDYYGDYEGVGAAHYALEAYMQNQGLTFKAPALERYVTDPASEPDTSKWLTEIVYLVE
jgi:carbon monoxide dehydrogenase subunit G